MRRAARLCALYWIVWAPACVANEIDLPSGQSVTLHDTIDEQHGGETWLILRYVAPEIGTGLKQAAAAADLDHLCATEGLEQARGRANPVDQIVITLMEEPVPRGVAAPDTIQYFGGYRLNSGACIWEPF